MRSTASQTQDKCSIALQPTHFPTDKHARPLPAVAIHHACHATCRGHTGHVHAREVNPGFATLMGRALAVLGADGSGNQPAMLLRAAQLAPSATDLGTLAQGMHAPAEGLAAGIPISHASHPNLALRSSVEAAMRPTLDGEGSGTACRPPYPRPPLAACGCSPCRQPAMVEQQCRSRIVWPGCPTLAYCSPPISCIFNPSSTSLTLSPTLPLPSPQDIDVPCSSQPHSWPKSARPAPLTFSNSLSACTLPLCAAPGCGRDCTGCPTEPACLNGRPKTEKPCCWTSTGPKPKDGFCYQYSESDNSCGAW